MNILYLVNHLNIGGITSYVFSLANNLKKRGHKVFVASSGGELLPQFLKEDINCILLPLDTKQEIGLKIWRCLFKLSFFIKQYEIDLVHSNTRTTQVLGYLLKKKTGVCYISTCHGFFKRRLLRKIFPCWGKRVIAISKDVKEHLVKDFRVPERNIHLVLNGVDVERFRISEYQNIRISKRKDFGLKEGPIVGIISRLSKEKGHIYLIEAMKIVLEKIPQAQLVIVGDGRQREKLKKLVWNLGLEENVFFFPSLADTREILALIDVFVLPSLKEGLGLALLEAMACGCAVIGSAVGGIKNVIQEGINGLLVRPQDTRDLAAKILELLVDQEKRKSLGRRAQIFVSENFSLEKMVLETERVYLECLGERYAV
ncbi:MAG: glycosyltransferase family 4 protein [Candidatus Omnitrophica bacterium]|nr:glycosyltransferase family 4 protein [Candidatus Omnitrophota bacterium]